MTLVLHAPTSPVNPAIPVNALNEFLRSRMIEECKSTVIRVAEEAMQEITKALSAFGVPAQAAPIVAAEAPVVPNEPTPAVPEVSKPETIQPKAVKQYKRKGYAGCVEANKRNSLASVLPAMLKYDRDFGGTLSPEGVCHAFRFSTRVYNKYKKKVLIIRRCYKVFGGEMNMKQAMAASGVQGGAFARYVKHIKEGLNDSE